MRVSVALCTLDGKPFIRDQILSIITQSRLPDEIVIGDDGSTDGTLDRALECIDGLVETVILPPEDRRLGVVANFERTMERTTGDVIALADQDDRWHPRKLETQLERMAARSVLLTHTDAILVDAEGDDLQERLSDAIGMTRRDRKRLQDPSEAFPVLLRRNFVTGATTVVRRTLVEASLPVPAGWLHDEWLGIQAAIRGGTAYLPTPLIDYRQHGSNAVGQRVLTPRDRVDRLLAPRTNRNARLLQRAASLADRVDSDPVARDAALAKLAHERRRSSLPSARWARLPAVARGVISGDYRRFGNGVVDAGRDMVQAP